MRQMYCIYDKVAMAMHGGIVLHAHDGPVARMFLDLLADKDQMVSRHPADYELWCLATISDDLVITPLSFPRVILTGDEFVSKNLESL